MFPLNAVLFPGVSVPLTVFEDRYRALVHHLLRVDPEERYFGSVGIREGYEVGDHGAQSLFRIGCRVKMTDVAAHADGTFSVVAVGLERISLEHLDVTGATLSDRSWTGRRPRPGRPGGRRAGPGHVHRYRTLLMEFRDDPYPTRSPRTRRSSPGPSRPSPRSAAGAAGPLEAEDAELRLLMVTELLRTELRAMNVIPSLPATEVARTRWSPN